MKRSIVELIAAKRDGHPLSRDEIARIIADFQRGEIADYQLSAFLMASFLRGLSDDETVALTEAMLHSGTVLDLSHVPGVKVDKINTLNRKGKTRRTKFGMGKRKDTKRAIVSLREGSIDIFGGPVG